jgi:hypothetical protein
MSSANLLLASVEVSDVVKNYKHVLHPLPKPPSDKSKEGMLSTFLDRNVFHALLEQPNGYNRFAEFLEKERSAENLKFFTMVCMLRSCKAEGGHTHDFVIVKVQKI